MSNLEKSGKGVYIGNGKPHEESWDSLTPQEKQIALLQAGYVSADPLLQLLAKEAESSKSQVDGVLEKGKEVE